MSKNIKQPGFLTAFFGFKRMVSPAFITFFYYIGLIGILVGVGFALMGSGPLYDQLMQSGLGAAGTIGYYIGVVVFALISILVLRFYSELLIVLFTISNRLRDISATLGETKAVEAVPAPAPGPTPAPVTEPEPEPEPEPVAVVEEAEATKEKVPASEADTPAEEKDTESDEPSEGDKSEKD